MTSIMASTLSSPVHINIINAWLPWLPGEHSEILTITRCGAQLADVVLFYHRTFRTSPEFGRWVSASLRWGFKHERILTGPRQDRMFASLCARTLLPLPSPLMPLS